MVQSKTVLTLFFSIVLKVAIFDTLRKLIVWQTCGGHTETVFDCRICPSDKDTMATCSFDGTIRLWNIQTMKCDIVTKSIDAVLYSLAWSPDGKQIAASDSLGRVHLFNAQKGALIRQLQHHKVGEKVYRVVWNPDIERDFLASISNDGTCVVFNSNGTKERVLRHKSAGRGVAWNPIQSNLLATSCMEGYIYIWDMDMSAADNSFMRILHGYRYSLCHSAIHYAASESRSCTCNKCHVLLLHIAQLYTPTADLLSTA